MDEEAFRRYIAEFNAANFDALVQYYADDVVFSFNGGLTLHGRDAIVAFYRPFRQAVDQTADIQFLVMNDEHVAVEMATEFRARQDYANFTRGPLRAGDTLRITVTSGGSPGLQAGEETLQQALRHQHQAFAAFFDKRARYPRFKSRNGRQSAHYTRSAFSFRGGVLRLAKTAAPLRYVWSWPDADVTALDPATVIVAREPDGRWYVTFTVDAAEPEPLAAAGRSAGVDLGVKDFAVTSDGERIANPRHLECKARNLARYQRRLARCRKGSANRARAKAKVARAHRKVRDARRDFLHKTSTRLTRANDAIAVEDLNVKGMVRNRSLARVISDCGWGEFRAMLAYKCERYGRTLTVIDRWYPSSKTCSACGHLLAELSLKTRHWTCPSCGARHDRDVNAAKNILAAG